MSLTFDEIVAIVQSRQEDRSPLIDAMIDIRDRYNVDVVIPWGNDEDRPDSPPLTAQHIGNAIEFHAMRAGSVAPYVNCPAVDPSKDEGVRSREYAAIRRKTLYSTYHHSMWNLQSRRGFRQLYGYATTAIQVQIDEEEGRPRLQIRDPLSAYPEPKAPEDLSPLANCAFIHTKSGDWLRRKYPQSITTNGGPVPPQALAGTSDEWDIVEWLDDEVTVFGILGPHDFNRSRSIYSNVLKGRNPYLELHRYPNKIGCCPVVMPARVTLDRLLSPLAGEIPNVDLQARLQHLHLIATEKAIFPDRYVTSKAGQAPKIVGGHWKDGRSGETNIIENVDSIGELRSTPDQAAMQQLDRLERDFRLSTGLVPQAGGESYGAMRTGRGQDSLMSAAVDPRIQEMQEVWAASMERVNRIALETFKAHWPNKTYHLFTGWAGDTSEFVLEPAKHIESTANVVNYAIAGADVQGVTIQLGQLNSMGVMSKRSVMAKHPHIEDPDVEERRIEEEALEQASMEGILQQVASGQMPVTQVARIAKHRKNEPSILDAILKADEEAKQEQAKYAAPPAEDQFASPDNMPGLAPGGPMPPESPMPPGMPPVDGSPPLAPNENLKGLRRVMESLNASPPVGAV